MLSKTLLAGNYKTKRTYSVTWAKRIRIQLL